MILVYKFNRVIVVISLHNKDLTQILRTEQFKSANIATKLITNFIK